MQTSSGPRATSRARGQRSVERLALIVSGPGARRPHGADFATRARTLEHAHDPRASALAACLPLTSERCRRAGIVERPSGRPQQPLGFLPRWVQDASGLLVPLGVADRHGAPLKPTVATVTETGLAVPDPQPSSLDHVGVYVDEEFLGDGVVTTIASLRAYLASVPFDHVMIVLARMAAKACAFLHDREAQRGLAMGIFSGSRWQEAVIRFLHQVPRSVLFGEQASMIVQRLAVDHAAPSVGFDVEPRVNVAQLARMVIGAGSLLASASGPVGQPGDVRREDVLAFIVQSGAYSHDAAPMGEIARQQQLLEDIAPQLLKEGHDKASPIDEWMREDYALSIAEQFRLGYGLAAMVHIFDDGPAAGDVVRALPEHATDLLVKLGWESRADEVLGLISIERRALRDELAARGDDLAHIVWEVRPFMRHPFVRFDDGSLLLTTPRALFSWLTDGFHYRLLDSAQARNTSARREESRKYSSFAGTLVERYAIDLVRSSYAVLGTAMLDRVHGEQPYGRGGGSRTTDIAIDLGTDLILIEVSGSRLRADTLVLGQVDQVIEDIDRMVITKLNQISNCIDALQSGTATIPAGNPTLELSRVHRIWPIVVTAGPLTQNEFLWAHIRGHTSHQLAQPKVQPPTLLDLEDLEALCGMIEARHHLPTILESKTRPPYRELELAVWATTAPDAPASESRPAMVEDRFERASRDVIAAVNFAAGIQPDQTA
jgi:hypothetical protein